MSTLLNCIVLKSYNLEFNEGDDDELDWKELSSLSDFSFNGDDDDDDGLDRDDCIQSLAIDDIPYDRDLKYINTPNGARTKPTTIVTSNQRRIFQQVQNITAGNTAELVHLDAHYAKLDTLKRDHENKYLVDVSEGRNVLVPQQGQGGQSSGQRKPGRTRTRRGGRRAHPKKLLLGRSRPIDGGDNDDDDDDEEEEEDDNGVGDQITDDDICNGSDNAGNTTAAQLQKLNKQSVLHNRVLRQTTTTTAATDQRGKNEGMVKKYPSLGRNKYDHAGAGANNSVRFDNHDDDEEDDSNGVMAKATPPSVPTQQLKVLRFEHDSESYHRHEQQTHRHHNGMHDVRQVSSHRHLDEQLRRNDDTRVRQERRDSADDTTHHARHPQDRPRYGDERGQRDPPRRYAHSRELFTHRNDTPVDMVHVKEDDSLHNSTPDTCDPSNREHDPPVKLESSRYHFHSSSSRPELLQPPQRNYDSSREQPPQRNYDSSREQPPQRNYDSSREQPPQRNYDSPREQPPQRNYDSSREQPSQPHMYSREQPPQRNYDSPREQPPQRNYDSSREQPSQPHMYSREQPPQRNYDSSREQPPQRNLQRSSYEGQDRVSQQQRLMITRDQLPRHGDNTTNIIPLISSTHELQSSPLPSKNNVMTSLRNPPPHLSHHHQRGDVSTDLHHHHHRNNYVDTHEMTRYNVEASINNNNNNIRHPESQRTREPLQRNVDGKSNGYGHIYANQDQVQIVATVDAATAAADDDDDDDCNETTTATSVGIPLASLAAVDPDSARPVPHHGGGFNNSSYAKKVFRSHFKPATVKGSSSNTTTMSAGTSTTTTTTTTTTTADDSNATAVEGIGGKGVLFIDDVDLNAPTTEEVGNDATVHIPPSYPTHPTAYRDHSMALPYGGYVGATTHIPVYPPYIAASHMNAYGYAIPMIPPTPTGEYNEHPQDMRYHHSNSKPKHHRNSTGGRFNKSYPPNYYKNQRYNNNINNNINNNNNNYYQGNNNNNNNNNNYPTNNYQHKSTTTKLDDAMDDEDYSSTSPKYNQKLPPAAKVEKTIAAAGAGATPSVSNSSASTGRGMTAEAIAAALKLKLNPQATEFVPLVGCSATTMTG